MDDVVAAVAMLQRLMKEWASAVQQQLDNNELPNYYLLKLT